MAALGPHDIQSATNQCMHVYSISQEICTQSLDCTGASKTTPMNIDKYFMWIHYERLRNHNKAKHNKTVRIFLGIYCTCYQGVTVENLLYGITFSLISVKYFSWSNSLFTHWSLGTSTQPTSFRYSLHLKNRFGYCLPKYLKLCVSISRD